MKDKILASLEQFKGMLRALRKDLSSLKTPRVSKKALRTAADAAANFWVEELRSPLEHRFKLPPDTVAHASDLVKRLHVLSRPNNHVQSYLEVIDELLDNYDDIFILPIKQMSSHVERIMDLTKLIPSLPNPDESSYLKEAIDCASSGYLRAAVVMGWCAAVDRMQRKILSLGFTHFNNTSTAIKNQTTGKFKRWNKEFRISTLSELQQVFDTDLIIVMEGMGLLDGNQAERLDTCFQYRCHSAHPGEAPIGEPHVIAFFNDIAQIILSNPKLQP